MQQSIIIVKYFNFERHNMFKNNKSQNLLPILISKNRIIIWHLNAKPDKMLH
jgi:hypothetical protein